MFNSQKKKIIATITFLTLLCTITFVAMSYFGVQRAVMTQMKNDGITLVGTISRELKGYQIKDTNKIREIFNDVKTEGKGNIVYVSLVDMSMNMLVSSDDSTNPGNTKKSNEAVDAVTSATEQGSVESVVKEEKITGFIFKRPDGEKVYNVSAPFYEASKLVGTINIGISLKSMYSIIVKGLLEALAVALIIQVVALILGVIISKTISNPLIKIVDKLDDFSKGDFTVKFDCKSKDEIGKVTESLNNSLYILKNTIAHIKNTVIGLNTVSYHLTSSGGEVAASSEEVAQATSSVFRGIEEQTANITEIADAIERFGCKIDDIQGKVKLLSESGKEIKQSADNGAVRLNELVKSIDVVKGSFVHTEDSIKNLNDNVSKIGEITNVINAVAEQTNLLALNAAIEAARAGDAGRGFAVVADEIRKLAEQVLTSSKSINKLIELVGASTTKVADLTTVLSDKLDNQVNLIGGTVESFTNIQKELNSTMPQIEEAYKALNNSVEEKEIIRNRIEELASVAEEVSVSAEEISAAAEKQSETIIQLSGTAQELNTMAEGLNREIEKFKV